MIRLMEEIQHYLSYTSAADPDEAARHGKVLDDVKAGWKNAQFVVEEQSREIKRLERELKQASAEREQLYADAALVQAKLQARIDDLENVMKNYVAPRRVFI